MEDLLRHLEAVLFIADEPVPTADLAVLFELPSHRIEELLAALAAGYEESRRGIVLRSVAGGWRLATHPESAPYLERFVGEQRHGRLSQAALETLAMWPTATGLPRPTGRDPRGLQRCSPEDADHPWGGRGGRNAPGAGPGDSLRHVEAVPGAIGAERPSDLPALAEFMPDTKAVERMESDSAPVCSLGE